jgi:hypothetical protein
MLFLEKTWRLCLHRTVPLNRTHGDILRSPLEESIQKLGEHIWEKVNETICKVKKQAAQIFIIFNLFIKICQWLYLHFLSIYSCM